MKDFMFMNEQEIVAFSNTIEEAIFSDKDVSYENTIKDFCYAVTKAKYSIIISKHLYSQCYDKELIVKMVDSSIDSIKRVIDDESLNRWLGNAKSNTVTQKSS